MLARELGISCTIDPDNMASATVPDKLAIASFVYQLHSYFNENIPSAVSSANRNIQPLPQKGMAEFDKITMSKLESDNSLVGARRSSGSPSSDRLKKYSRHMVKNSNDNQVESSATAAPSTDETVKELFPKVQAAEMNGIDEVVDREEKPSENVDELFPRVGSGKSEKTKTEASQKSQADTTEEVPNVVVSSPTKDISPGKNVLANIRAKSPDKKTVEDNMADQVVVLNPPPDIPPQPVVSNDAAADPQVVINLDNTVDEISVSGCVLML